MHVHTCTHLITLYFWGKKNICFTFYFGAERVITDKILLLSDLIYCAQENPKLIKQAIGNRRLLLTVIG